MNEYEERFEVRPVGVRYRCEVCNRGYMEVTNDSVFIPASTLPPGPIMRPHVCTNCGAKLTLPGTYPRIEWIPIEDHFRKEGGNESAT